MPIVDSSAAAVESPASSLQPFFAPKVVAVVGANRDRGHLGSEVFHNLLATGFTGTAIPVHPAADEIEGRRAYRRVSDIPEAVDLAVIVVPGGAGVPAAVDDCLRKGVRAICIITAGFGESSVEGREIEAAMVRRIRDAGCRLIGPNCMGLLNTDPDVCLNATFSPVYPPAGSVAMSTQSGALGVTILDYARQLNIGISSFVSVGNKADVSGNDLLEFWEHDPRTSVILLYLESFGNPAKFSRIARRIGRSKPIVALKSGRSTAGARAAASHTGALASADAFVDALFHQSGVIRTDTVTELFDVATLLARQPIPRGRRVAILTNAGGPGILAVDACQAHGLTVADLSEATKNAICDRSCQPRRASPIRSTCWRRRRPSITNGARNADARRGRRQRHGDLHSPTGHRRRSSGGGDRAGGNDEARQAGVRHLHAKRRGAGRPCLCPLLRVSRTGGDCALARRRVRRVASNPARPGAGVRRHSAATRPRHRRQGIASAEAAG